jgi:hypothetical protein
MSKKIIPKVSEGMRIDEDTYGQEPQTTGIFTMDFEKPCIVHSKI